MFGPGRSTRPSRSGPAGLVAHPLFYGLMMFDRALGPDARLARTRLYLPTRAAAGAHLKAWAVRVSGGRLNVLLIDKGNRSIRVDLRVPASGPATIERLLAPSVSARSGVILAGQHVGRDARWHGQIQASMVWPRSSGYVVTVPRMSAALIGMRFGSAARPARFQRIVRSPSGRRPAPRP